MLEELRAHLERATGRRPLGAPAALSDCMAAVLASPAAPA